MTVPLVIATLDGLDRHDTGPFHPERPARLRAVEAGVARAELGDAAVRIDGQPAPRADLARVHSEVYLDALADLSAAGGGSLDPDTPVAVGSWSTAVLGAGLGLSAVAALRSGQADAAFVCPRPPGHHATAQRGMGFCLLNNVAVTAAALAAAGERVVIVDWDVHHGNGTQEIFWDDPDVLYVSTHEWPAYPGTGRASETGGPGAVGATVNIPLPAGATGDVALAAMDELVGPVVDAFAPAWVLISAGFDAHRDDPLAGLEWSAGDFASLTERVASFATVPGRVIAFLEGGYDLDALSHSVTATVATLAGCPRPTEPTTLGGPGHEAVERALRWRTDHIGSTP